MMHYARHKTDVELDQRDELGLIEMVKVSLRLVRLTNSVVIDHYVTASVIP